MVRCTRGAILDVIVDLRPESPTFLQHTSVELTADNRRSFFVPARFAHGYQVLEDATEVAYLTGAYYAPEHEGGLPYDDPRLAIAWPLAAADMSDRDRRWAPLDAVESTMRTRMAAGGRTGTGA
jgi:dTDP-4-dehydrorhamnose 3,5-epimerase